MKTRALCLLALSSLLVLGLAWAISAVQDLRAQVADHGARIERLER